MSIQSVKIVGSFLIGGGINCHAEYQLHVTTNVCSYTIYRRFNQFQQLHGQITKNMTKEIIKEKDLEFIDNHQFYGSYIASTKSIVQQRQAYLQQFLNKLLSNENYRENEHLLLFLDINNRGVSGMVRELGESAILRESFLKVKVINNQINGLFASFGLYFVVLVRSGQLYVLSSMYHTSMQAIMLWNLRDGTNRIVPNASNMSIKISSFSNDRKLILRFPSQEVIAFWVRTLSEFTADGNLQSFESTARNSKQRSQGAHQDPNSYVPSPVKQENVYAQGTGHTHDELSAMYGV